MTNHRATDRARGLLALAALLALTMGVPAFLATAVGWPLPARLPDPSTLSEAIAGRAPIADDVWIRALACIAWILWARVTVAVVTAAVAACRGRPHAAQGLGRLASTLVTTAVLIASTPRPVAAAPLPALRPLPATAYPAAQATPRDATPSQRTSAPERTWTVRPDDTLWDIAQHTLGDPLRWSEIYDLNRDRPQPGGDRLTDPSRLTPGWTLLLPADADASTRLEETQLVTVEPGDTLSELAAETLGDADRYPELFEGSIPLDQPDGTHLTDPNFIRPGWHIAIPSTRATPSAETTPVTISPPPELPTPTTAPPPDTEPLPTTTPGPISLPTDGVPQTSTALPPPAPSTPEPEADRSAPISTPLVAAGVLTSGVIAAVTAARLRRRRSRRRGDRPFLLAADDAVLETRVRRAAAVAAPLALADALNQLATNLPAEGEVSAFSVAGDGTVEVLLSSELDAPPPGWILDTTGRVLTTTCLNLDNVGDGGVQRWIPATVGVTDEREVLVDLAAPPLTTINGNPEESLALFRSLLLATSTTALRDDLDIVYIGKRYAPALERLRVVDPADAVEELARTEAANARARQDDNTSAAVAFVDSRFVDDETVSEIVELAGPGLSVVVLSDQDFPRGRRLVAEDAEVEVRPLGLRIEVAATPEESAALWDLVEDNVVATDLIDPPSAVDGGESAPEVVVHLLGRVRIEGAAGEFSRRVAEEVIAYLAVHPAGADEERLMTALWPDRAPARSSFNQALSRARVGLGVSTTGEHHLPHLAADRLYRLAPTVTADVLQLDALLTTMRDRPSEATLDASVAGLEKVDGIPFSGRGPGFEWAHAEGFVAWAQAIVSDLAHLVAGALLLMRYSTRATSVLRAALRACPADEVLYRDLMRAHDTAGNPAGVEAAFRELCAVIEAEIPQDEVHPETWELFTQLVPRALRSVS